LSPEAATGTRDVIPFADLGKPYIRNTVSFGESDYWFGPDLLIEISPADPCGIYHECSDAPHEMLKSKQGKFEYHLF
jgi:hypothetical protein